MMYDITMACDAFKKLIVQQLDRVAKIDKTKTDFTTKEVVNIGVIDGDGIGPIITQVMFSIPTAIFTEAFLSFVGVGIALPQCSVGTLIEDGFNNITTLPYQILPPIIVLALLMLGFNFIGDGLREALAPKLEDM